MSIIDFGFYLKTTFYIITVICVLALVAHSCKLRKENKRLLDEVTRYKKRDRLEKYLVRGLCRNGSQSVIEQSLRSAIHKGMCDIKRNCETGTWFEKQIKGEEQDGG